MIVPSKIEAIILWPVNRFNEALCCARQDKVGIVKDHNHLLGVKSGFLNGHKKALYAALLLAMKTVIF